MDRKTGLALSGAVSLVFLAAVFSFGPRLGIFGTSRVSADGSSPLTPDPVVTVEVTEAPAPATAASSASEAPVRFVDVPAPAASDDHGSDDDDHEDDDHGDDEEHEDDD